MLAILTRLWVSTWTHKEPEESLLLPLIQEKTWQNAYQWLYRIPEWTKFEGQASILKPGEAGAFSETQTEAFAYLKQKSPEVIYGSKEH